LPIGLSSAAHRQRGVDLVGVGNDSGRPHIAAAEAQNTPRLGNLVHVCRISVPMAIVTNGLAGTFQNFEETRRRKFGLPRKLWQRDELTLD
jgi:hypothetical protein